MNKDLSIIIVNYNTPDLVYNCVRSLEKHLKNIIYEIIVVDNGSKEELRIKNNELRKISPSSFSIQLLANRGFGAGNNAGAKKATGKYLLLLNSDALLVDNSIETMYRFLSTHNEIGALTCLLYNDLACKKRQKNFFGKFQSLGSLTIRRYNYQKIDRAKEFFYTDIVTGACLMIRREIFEKVGAFDENIFMYLEDDDLCKRIVDAGYKNAVLTSAKIVHLEGKSIKMSSERKKMYYDSQAYFWRKHYGFWPTMLMKIFRWPIKYFETNK